VLAKLGQFRLLFIEVEKPFGLVEEVAKWNEFSALAIALRHQWLFRGHRSVHWSLSSTLERMIKQVRKSNPGVSCEQAETYLMDQFAREAHHYGEAFKEGETFELLATMQHHGVPTRLLDFTSSIYIAAFFAIADATPEDRPCIWAVDTTWIESAVRSAFSLEESAIETRLAESPDQSTFMKRLGLSECQESVDRIRSTSDRPRAAAIDQFLRESIGLPMSHRRTRGVLHARPYRLSDRLRLQHGAFLMPLDVEESFESNLAAMLRAEPAPWAIRRIVFSETFDRSEFLAQFYHLNLSERTLFPGIDGFSRSLIRKYEVMATELFREGRQDGETFRL
jgi:hypothetical protein